MGLFLCVCVFFYAYGYLKTFRCIFAFIIWVSSVHTNPKSIYYHRHKSPHVTPILRQSHPVYTVLSYSQNIHLNITLPSAPSSMSFQYFSRHFERMYHPGKQKRFTVFLSFLMFIFFFEPPVLSLYNINSCVILLDFWQCSVDWK